MFLTSAVFLHRPSSIVHRPVGLGWKEEEEKQTQVDLAMAPSQQNTGELPSAEEVVDVVAGSEKATRKPISTVVMVISMQTEALPLVNKFQLSEDHDGLFGGSKRGGDFLSGFSLGGVVFGTLAYVFDPQLRRYILNEDEYGFRRPRRLVYYEDESGLEKARQTLNWKIRQLNFAIDRVSLRLRGEKEMPDPESIEANSWFGATL
ncbi:hypothetical protein HPP92_028272 [Vanilla planifolia]|uniref:Uncharacterized protein n=1 Tax=Vanilla planifolia TaxID=51239 RepID=A0A835P5X5_VANPL|nr:hypothetical protein HPP92_028272 [Vanilla planifolia]